MGASHGTLMRLPIELWSRVAGIGYGLGEWAMGNVIEPEFVEMRGALVKQRVAHRVAHTLKHGMYICEYTDDEFRLGVPDLLGPYVGVNAKFGMMGCATFVSDE